MSSAKLKLLFSALVMILISGCTTPPAESAKLAIEYPGVAPGTAVGWTDGEHFTVSNDIIKMQWSTKGKKLTPMAITDLVTGEVMGISTEAFRIELANGKVISSNDLELRWVKIKELNPITDNPRATDHFTGKKIVARFELFEENVDVIWKAILIDDANYIRHGFGIRPLEETIEIKNIVMYDDLVPNSKMVGKTKGSVLATDTMFFAFEHPMAQNSNGSYPLTKIYDYKSDQVSGDKRTNIVIDVTKQIQGNDQYRAEVRHHSGDNRLNIYSGTLFANGTEIGKDEHHGWSDNKVDEHQFYTFDVTKYSPKTKYMLRLEVQGEGGNDSQGVVNMDRTTMAPNVYCAYARNAPLAKGRTYQSSMVTGVTPKGQLRRSFLYYRERERSHPYRTFLHYNSWYDIGYFTPYNERDCLETIEAFGRELVEKRGVVLDSFLFDDGWDNYDSIWEFHDGFPNGFHKVAAATAKYGTAPGVWLSPWGGYGGPREKRVAIGRKEGLDIYEDSKDPAFKMSGPKYNERFKKVCLDMVRNYGVNQFKFDGVGSAEGVSPADAAQDFEATIELIRTLRKEKKEIYINLTTGTWPSPFWLNYADSIWRGGFDHGLAGDVGSDRQKWITYRDGHTYQNIVTQAPLYPLNALMFHGVIYAKKAYANMNLDPQNDLQSEIRSGFGSGSQLQELYITPALMTKENWDDLADAAKWARKNAKVLVDTHWVGGNPMKQEIYGWASWNKTKGCLTLRNASDKPQSINLDAQKIFELPEGAVQTYELQSPYKDQRIQEFMLSAGRNMKITLQPFEVLVFDATPDE